MVRIIGIPEAGERTKDKDMGKFGAFWGIAGVSLLLGRAVISLSGMALAAFSEPFKWYHWVTLVVVLFFMAYSEGYKAFQKGFSPRVAARARYLQQNPKTLHVVLAPLFCMGFIHATKRRKITSICVLAGIVVLILLVRLASQPWRGIIDVGVVVGLTWGLISLWYFTFQAFTNPAFDHPADTPDA